MVFSKFNENNKFSLIWVFRSIVPKSSMWIIVITLCPSLSSGASICFLHSHILHWNHWTIWKQSLCWWEIYGAKYCRTYLIQDPSQKPQTWLTLNYSWTSEWVSDCCLMPNEQFFSYIMARTSYWYIRW